MCVWWGDTNTCVEVRRQLGGAGFLLSLFWPILKYSRIISKIFWKQVNRIPEVLEIKQEINITYLYRSDSKSVNCRAISIGWSVIRSNVSNWPGLLICHSIGGGGLSKVILWLIPFAWACFFLLMILAMDSTHFFIAFPGETREAPLTWPPGYNTDKTSPLHSFSSMWS